MMGPAARLQTGEDEERRRPDAVELCPPRHANATFQEALYQCREALWAPEPKIPLPGENLNRLF